MAKPSIPDIQTLIQAGINPKNGLPLRLGDNKDGWRKASIRASLRILDEQNAVNRYQWYNLPCKLSSQELERLLYYKGQLAFFYIEELDEFYFMPYALDGSIDFYGRFNTIHPVPMVSGTTQDEKTASKAQADYLSTLKLNCIYDVPLGKVDHLKSCVLLHDYTKQLSQTLIPRKDIQEPILDIMSDMIPFCRTALLNSTGIMGMRVNNQDEYSNVLAASDSIDRAAIEGKKYIPIIGAVEFQEMTGGSVARGEEFLMAMQSLDNYRLSLYGLENGGIFQKKSHMLESEMSMNMGKCAAALQDGLSIRQNFCDIVNSIWGLGISCEVSENAIEADLDMDGDIDTDVDQSGNSPGQQKEQINGGEEK